MKKQRIELSRAFIRRLLIVVAAAFLASMLFAFFFQTHMLEKSAASRLDTDAHDVKKDIDDASDKNLLWLTRVIARKINSLKTVTHEELVRLTRIYRVREINIIDENGIITISTNNDFVGYDMRDGEQSAEFMCLLDGSHEEYVQKYGPMSLKPELSRKYAGVVLKAGGFVEVGHDSDSFQKEIKDEVKQVSKNRHVGQTGSVIIADEDGYVVNDRDGHEGEKIEDTGLKLDRENVPAERVFTAEVHGRSCYCLYMLSEGYVIVPVLPESELLDERNFALLTMGAVEITFFVGLFFILFLLFRRHQETTAEAARIEHELSIAKQIQESALPVGVSPFPDRTEFSLHASMDAAREVGGDFYDFFPMDDGRLVFLIADVSGKGIPAAMFMMTSKSLIRSRADQAETLAGVFEQVNDRLCDGNESGMFLTAWMGALDIETGMVRFVNAGHNAPVLIRDGKASFVEQSPGLMLAMMEEMEYTEQLIELVPGDILYLYTDGVTEASKEDESRLGNDRLLEILSGNYGTGEEACRRICETVREQVDVFAEGAEQFDDITQVCLYYEGS